MFSYFNKILFQNAVSPCEKISSKSAKQLDDPLSKDCNVRFPTLPLKALLIKYELDIHVFYLFLFAVF